MNTLFSSINLSHRVTETTNRLHTAAGAFMRMTLALAITCLALGGIAAADDAQASFKRQTNIPPQELAPALQTLAKERDIQVVYRSELVGERHTSGAAGDLTLEQALKQLLNGTGLTYRYLDDKGITIIPLNPLSTSGESENSPNSFSALEESEGAGASGKGEDSRQGGSDEVKGTQNKSFWDRFRVAQLGKGKNPANSSSSEEGDRNSSRTNQNSDMSSGSDTSMEEIIVTANKLNAQKVLDVPGAIQAISGDSLQKAGASGFLDVADKIPGLSIQDLGPGDRKYVVRGINSIGDSTVGVYYDEAVISGSNANDGGGFESDIRLYDLDRIEVLRGPQGTLYGASSMSGTIRFITKKPDLDKFGGYLTVEASGTQHGAGNYDANGEINLPIIDDKLALRVVAWSLDDSGYIDQIRVGAGVAGSATPNGFLAKGVNNDVVKGGRVSLLFRPIENLTIDASLTEQSESSNGSSRYTPAGTAPFVIPGTVPVKGCDLCNTDATRSPSNDLLHVYSLTGAYTFSYGVITATTNQFNRRIDFTFDNTPALAAFGIPQYFVTQSEEPRTRDVNSSEIRYASNFDFPVNFVVGGFRQYETNRLMVASVTANALGNPSGPFSELNSQDALAHPGVGDTYFGRTDDRTTTEYAGFGEATWKITHKFTVSGGLRYFIETLDGVQEQTHPFGGLPSGQSLVPIPDKTQTFKKLTFKANASYKFNDTLLAYLTASQGFRAGGLNAQSEPFEPIPTSFAPDTLWNYEAGAKGRLFGGKLDYQVDAYALFWYNIQVQKTTADGAFNYTGNGGDAVVKGFEFEFTAHPLPFVTASFAGSYQDAYLLHGATAAEYAANPTLGLSGDKIPDVAPFQFALGVDYTRPLNNEWIGTLAADINYRGSTNSYFTSNSLNIPLQSYALVNLRAGVVTGPWEVNVFARNVGNVRAQISAINSFQDPDARLTVRPRTVGINLTRKF